MSEPALRAEGLGKVYRGWLGGRVEALSGLELTVERGEIFGFLGQNGAGKTTTIHVLMGFLNPTAGRAWVLGQPAGTAEVYRRVGFLPENLTFYPFLTGRQLLELFCRLLKLDDAETRRRIAAAAESIPLEDALDRKVKACSRGMLQRLGLAQAVLGDPDLLLLDEPSSGLDPLGRRDVRKFLQCLKEQGKTILLSSHILSDIEQICDRVAIVKGGRVMRSGSITELLRDSGGTSLKARGLEPARMRVLLAGARDVTIAEDGMATAVFPAEEAAQAAVVALVGAGAQLLEMVKVRSQLEDIFVDTVTRKEAP